MLQGGCGRESEPQGATHQQRVKGNCLMIIIYLSIKAPGDWTLGLRHTRQVFYHWTILPVRFYSDYKIWDEASSPGWPQTWQSSCLSIHQASLVRWCFNVSLWLRCNAVPSPGLLGLVWCSGQSSFIKCFQWVTAPVWKPLGCVCVCTCACQHVLWHRGPDRSGPGWVAFSPDHLGGPF